MGKAMPAKYSDDSQDKAWESFGKSGSGIGPGTLFEIAKICGCAADLLRPRNWIDPEKIFEGIEGVDPVDVETDATEHEDASASHDEGSKGGPHVHENAADEDEAASGANSGEDRNGKANSSSENPNDGKKEERSQKG